MKLNKLLENNNVSVSGFKAFEDLEKCNKNINNKIILSTFSAGILASQNITEYYAPVIPRGSKFSTAEDIVEADLDVKKYKIAIQELENIQDVVLLTQHGGTMEILKNMHPSAKVLEGNVKEEDIKDKYVVGALPPHLIQHVAAFKSATIADYNAIKDGDLKGKELEERLHITEWFTVEEIE